MRTLNFIVSERTLKQDPTSNFDGLFPAPNQHIEAEFSFSKEWESAVKVAAFYSIPGKEYPPQPINEEKLCVIPPKNTSKTICPKSFIYYYIGDYIQNINKTETSFLLRNKFA